MTISALRITPILLLSLAGCPGPTPSADTGASVDTGSADAPSLDSAASGDTAASVDSATSGDALSAIDGSSSGDAFSSADTTVASDGSSRDAPGADVPGAVRLELVEPYAYGNCFMGPSDPLLAFWTIRATGPAGEHVEVESATLRVRVDSRSYDTTQELVLDAPSFDIPASGMIDHMQRKSSGTPAIPMCTFCSDTVVGELTLQITTSTGAQSLTETLDLGCVF